MADMVACDKCGTHGPRRIGKIAPVGWFYVTTVHEESREIFYLYACSDACTQLDWTRGPGDLSAPDKINGAPQLHKIPGCEASCE